MKKKALSMLMAGTLAVSMLAACGGGSSSSAAPAAESTKTESTKTESTAPAPAAEGDNTLTVAAWDANFNIPALKAAEADYKANVNPDFQLIIKEQTGSTDVENAITLAGSSGDYSQLPDIVLFQDHFIQRYVADYPDAFIDVNDADVDWSDFGEEKLSYGRSTTAPQSSHIASTSSSRQATRSTI